MEKIQKLLVCTIAMVWMMMAVGCQKNDYFKDTGTIDPKYNGTILQYLENNPRNQFDSLVKLIKIAGMEEVFSNEKITFFAPADPSIIESIRVLNANLYSLGRDTITNLNQLHPDFVKQQLSYYLFKGERRLNDYLQLDPVNFRVYGGQYYTSYMGKIMLIGAIYDDAGGIRYAGLRRLAIGFFSGDDPPAGTLPPYYMVASSDINPQNGIVHALNYTSAFYFGFSSDNFVTNAINFGFFYDRR